MPRGSVEILSCFGGKHVPSKGSMPMRIRVLESRYQPGHVNLMLNSIEDNTWVRVAEAFDVDARDLLKALQLAGVVKSYKLPRRPRKHRLRLEGDTLVVNGKIQRFDSFKKAYEDKIAQADRYYRDEPTER